MGTGGRNIVWMVGRSGPLEACLSDGSQSRSGIGYGFLMWCTWKGDRWRIAGLAARKLEPSHSVPEVETMGLRACHLMVLEIRWGSHGNEAVCVGMSDVGSVDSLLWRLEVMVNVTWQK